MDATHKDDRLCERRREFFGRLNQYQGNRIVCVPGRFVNTIHDPLEFPDCWYVVANGVWNYSGSLVADASHDIKIAANRGNRVRIYRLPTQALGKGLEKNARIAGNKRLQRRTGFVAPANPQVTRRPKAKKAEEVWPSGATSIQRHGKQNTEDRIIERRQARPCRKSPAEKEA
jgi:hypothetical protein